MNPSASAQQRERNQVVRPTAPSRTASKDAGSRVCSRVAPRDGICCEPSCVNLVGTVSTLPGRELTHLGIMPPCADSTRSCVREEVYTAAVLQTERREEQQQAGPEHRTLPSRGGAVAVRVAVALRIAHGLPHRSHAQRTRGHATPHHTQFSHAQHTHTRASFLLGLISRDNVCPHEAKTQHARKEKSRCTCSPKKRPLAA